MERQQVFSDPSHSTETDDTLGRVVSPLYTQVLSGNTADNAPAAPTREKTIIFFIATPWSIFDASIIHQTIILAQYANMINMLDKCYLCLTVREAKNIL